MSDLFQHIEYLLARYNYARLPSMGTFVLDDASPIPDSKTLHKYVRFIPNQIDDDNRLNLLIAEKEEMNDKETGEKLTKELISLKKDLEDGNTIQCSLLGSLSYNNFTKEIEFTPNLEYKHPSTYGASGIDIRKLQHTENLKLGKKKIYQIGFYTILLAIAVILVLLPYYTHSVEDKANLSNFYENIQSISNGKKELLNKTAHTSENTEQVKYYIIIAEERIGSKALNILYQAKDSIFPNADILKTNNRYRIYASFYTDKDSAQNILTEIQSQQKRYQSAWIYADSTRH